MDNTDEQRVIDAVPKQLLIGGRWTDAKAKGRMPVEDPADNHPLCEVADAQPEDAVAALDAAVETQGSWQDTPPRERGEILRRSWQLIMDRIDDLALLMTLEMGKPVKESKAEITYAAEFFRWF